MCPTRTDLVGKFETVDVETLSFQTVQQMDSIGWIVYEFFYKIHMGRTLDQVHPVYTIHNSIIECNTKIEYKIPLYIYMLFSNYHLICTYRYKVYNYKYIYRMAKQLDFFNKFNHFITV